VAPTYRWRDPPNNRPENELLGVMSIGSHLGVYQGFNWIAHNTTDSYFSNTGLKDGDALTQLVGNEWDAVVDNGYTPAGLVILGASPVTAGSITPGMPRTPSQISNSARYRDSSGASVFATGSIQWMW